MKQLRYIIILIPALLLGSCATQKNTSATRWWKSFKSRYNTYFNGHQAYLEGMLAKVEGNKDDYTGILPLLMVTNKESQKLGQSNFETAVTKCEKTIKLYSIKRKPELKRGHRLTPKEKAFRNRLEFNPFLKNAWLLMGKAQMETGDYIGAASTFAYTERLYRDQTQVCNVARSLLALCYTQMDWFYDAEDLFNKIRRDNIPDAAKRSYNTAMTNYYLRQKKWKEALPYLEKEMKNLPHGIPKARGYFLLGQIYQELGMRTEAYKALQECNRKSPPYEMRFNAEILQTEVMPQGDTKTKLAKLNRMAKKVNNKKFLDRIYYAIGNVYMALPDTTRAIKAYETGNAKATQSGMAKAVLNLRLGDIYWTRHRFDYALRSYSAALNILNKERDRYDEISRKTKILDKLVPYTNEIQLQDSLQALVRMPEKERFAVIDKLIEIEKRRQKEAAKNTTASAAKSHNNTNVNTTQSVTAGNIGNKGTGNSTTWYFYNQQTVNKGAEQFRKIWGNRRNEDNWRRSNKSTLSDDDGKGMDYANENTTDASDKKNGNESDTEEKENKEKKAANDSAANDPLKREYYLAQLPFTSEQMKESNEKLKLALFGAGVVEKDELEDYSLAKNTLLRLYRDYPDYQPMEELLYQLYLLELHWGRPGEADIYKNRMTAEFPDSSLTLLITAPDYVQNARYGKHIEDSLYTATYNAYRIGDYAAMQKNCKISEEKYPKGDNRAKFLFLDAMTKLRQKDIDNFVKEMRTIATNYTGDKISELAGNIVKSIDEGRIPGTGVYDMNSLWANRNNADKNLTEASMKNDSLTADRLENFIMIVPFDKDSIDEGKLLYEISRFNFTNFNIRNFEIELIEGGRASQMEIKGFLSFDEAHSYQQEIFQDTACHALLKNLEPVLISEHNFKLIGVKYSMSDYKTFYQKHFIPSKIKPDLKLDNNNGNFIWDEDQKVKKEDKDNNADSNNTNTMDTEDDGGEWY